MGRNISNCSGASAAAVYETSFLSSCFKAEKAKGKFGVEPQRNMLLQIAAKPSVLCCHLANTSEELGGLATAIPPFVKLLWSLL